MMRKTATYLALALFFAALLVGCAAPVTGLLYTDVKAPVTVTENPSYSKVGTGSAISLLGAVAFGDASIQAAAKSAGITKIHHVDYKLTQVLWVFGQYTVMVYGE